jgi:signal transduction histidine kinase
MARFKIRSQLFIANLLIIVALTGSLLLVIHHIVGKEIQEQVRTGTEDSVRAFQTVQRQREQQLQSTAAMVAELPTLKALMPLDHPLTIQDATTQFWQLARSDLFVLAGPNKKIIALHMTKPGWSQESLQHDLDRSIERGEDAAWWYDNGRLYWVFLRPIIAGDASDQRTLGILALGIQVDASVASQLAIVSGNQIALATGDTVIASTLPPADESALQRAMRAGTLSATTTLPTEISLATDRYTFASVLLSKSPSIEIRSFVLMPMMPVNTFMSSLNRTIYVLGGIAVLFGALLFGSVARTMTQPLENLVAGVRALANSDFSYSITPRGSSELRELSTAFAQMRSQLLASQQQRIETERVAALGRAASSISHDLRHYLAAIVANAEFLYEADELLKINKSEVYEEIKTASTQMTDLIDSLRELSYRRSTITAEPSNLSQVIHRSIDAIHAKPEFRKVHIVLTVPGDLEGVFDPKKLERAFFNLILNSCEAIDGGTAEIVVEGHARDSFFEIRVRDNGPGIPASIRFTLFDPFVSFGKPNGTGVGLAIVSKIVTDHGGSVIVEQTSEAGTTFLVRIPRRQPVAVAPVSSLSS